MSYTNFEKALEEAKKLPDYFASPAATEEILAKSEALLGVKFSKQCKEFYLSHNYISFAGNEVFGIDPDDLDELEGNSEGYTLNEREENNINEDWIVFYNFDDGVYACFDYSDLNEDGEPQIIVIEFNGEEYIEEEIIAEDFGNFLIQLTEK